MEQVLNLRLLCEKYSQHKQNLYHLFIGFKIAFDRVWHAALWDTMKRYNINHQLIKIISKLYEEASSAVLCNGSVGSWFRTSVGVRQKCLLSQTLLNIFLERIMTEALHDHEGTVSIGGRNVTNLRFADDIDGSAGSEEELAALANILDASSRKFGMEISAEKAKLMTNSNQPIHLDIVIRGSKLGTVDKFKYLGVIVSDLRI